MQYAQDLNTCTHNYLLEVYFIANMSLFQEQTALQQITYIGRKNIQIKAVFMNLLDSLAKYSLGNLWTSCSILFSIFYSLPRFGCFRILRQGQKYITLEYNVYFKHHQTHIFFILIYVNFKKRGSIITQI